MVKFSKRLLKVSVVICLIIGSFFIWSRGKYVVPILAYHHVDYVPKGELSLNTVTPTSFKRQMDFLRDHNYNVIRLYDLVKMIKEGQTIPHNSVVITFDDGYEDNFNYAFDVLRNHEFPSTVFVVSDLVGTDGFLTWEEIKEMMKHGVFIGSHSKTHAYLPEVSYEQQREEIIESRKILQEKLNAPINFIAYPSGGFSKQIKDIVKEAGYLGAVTTNRGFERLNKDVYELKRIRMKDNDTNFLVLKAKLSGYYNLFRNIKNPE